MKRILITGSKGQLGRSIGDLIPDYPDFEFLLTDKDQLDVTDPAEVSEVFTRFKPDFCINCAAYTNVEQAEKNPELAFKVNRDGAENIARACKKTGAIMIHISTDYVFDGRNTKGYIPSDQPNPLNAYGRSKYQGEKRIQELLDEYIIVRTSWLYSRKYPPNFYLTVLEKLDKGEHMVITDAQTGCPTDAENLAGYLLKRVQESNHRFGIFHFTDGKAMTWFDFARNIQKATGSDSGRNHISKGEGQIGMAQRPKSSILLAGTSNDE